jgi:hypothetical protein
MASSRSLALCALCALAAPVVAQSRISVLSISPANQAVGAPNATSIAVRFDATVDPATITARSFRVFGRWSGPVPGTRSVSGQQVGFEPSRPFFPGEPVFVNLSSAVRSTGGANLTGGFAAMFWAGSSPGSRNFTLRQTINLRTTPSLIATYGILGGDVDADGSPDIIAMNEVSHDVRVLLNDGCGAFGPMRTFPIGGAAEPSPSESADFDADGYLDLVTGNANGNTMTVFLNDKQGGFLPPVAYACGGRVHGIAVLDAEGDGDIDVVAPNRSGVLLFPNNGDGTFGASRFFDSGGTGEDNVAAADANGDGFADLFVGNLSSQTMVLMLNDGAGSFRVSASVPCGGSSFHIAVGDADGDGNADAVSANSNTGNWGLIRGNGSGGLHQVVTYTAGRSPTAIDLGDLDGDGRLDCVTAHYSSADFFVYWNGGGSFGTPLRLLSTSAGSCATLVDFDRDGDVDIIAADEIADQARLYLQTGPNPPGVQPPACAATLRIDELAGRAGFGGAQPRPVLLGALAHFGATGTANQRYAVVAGTGIEPGLPLPFGLLNLDATQPTLAIVNGFGGSGGVLNPLGEGRTSLRIPLTLPLGARIAFQGLVADPASASGVLLTNPEMAVVR